jgi:hypothetical protein
MLEARALLPVAIMRPEPSVLIGQVPVIDNPESIRAAINISQPVDATLASCLNA